MTDHVDFSPLAADYEKYRVGYGEEVFAAIGRRVGEGATGAILDLACGTGLSTVPLRNLTDGIVIGADIAAALMRRAPRETRGRHIAYVAADAHRLPHANAVFAAVTCGQAMHWMDADRVMPEVMRVLSPGGWFFAYWKYPAPEEPYQLLANEVLGEILGRTIESRYTLSTMPDLQRYGFADFSEEHFELPLPYTAETYVGFMRSRRRIRDIAGEHTEEFLRRYALELERLHPGGETFEERNLVYLFSGRKALDA